MQFVLRLFEDVLPGGKHVRLTTALPRALYVTAGQVGIDGRERDCDDGTVTLQAPVIETGAQGACLWRWEIAKVADIVEPIAAPPRLKLQAGIFDHDVSESHLLRLDSVAFPPGGCAYLHTHQGPGTRCLIEGRIRIDTDGHSSSFGPGGAWFEAGPEPVFAQADAKQPTRFIRAMVLPRQLLGKSSIRYVNEADQAKPKSQTYHVFGEELLGP